MTTARSQRRLSNSKASVEWERTAFPATRPCLRSLTGASRGRVWSRAGGIGARGSAVRGAKLGSDGSPRRGRQVKSPSRGTAGRVYGRPGFARWNYHEKKTVLRLSKFIVAFPALTPFSFLTSLSQDMSISCQVAQMISGARGLAEADCRAQSAFCPTLSLREPSRRSKYADRNRRLSPLALSLCP